MWLYMDITRIPLHRFCQQLIDKSNDIDDAYLHFSIHA
jgi:hypothetical protein